MLTNSAVLRLRTISSHLNCSQRLTSMSTVTSSSLNPEGVEVLQRKSFGGRTFILNRPEALNALSLSMLRTITPQLQVWEQSELAKVIMIKGHNSKTFCSGGDVKKVIQVAKTDLAAARSFFAEEYALNHLIASLKTPYVAILNGITMGGGAGLSVHAPFRIATENTVFAMPETAIGFYPDVGGTFFLPRLDGELGTYLALTGFWLKGEDVFKAGIATHYVPEVRLPELEDQLNELESDDPKIVNSAIEDFVAEPSGNDFSLSVHRSKIDRYFKYNSVDQIVKALKEDNSEWAEDTLGLLAKMSPTSLKVTLAQLRAGRELPIADCFQKEYRLTQHFLNTQDFCEGVTARLINKPRTTPQWKPVSLDLISDEKVRQEFLDKPAADPKLKLLANFNDMKYKHNFGLPSENEIKNLVTGENKAVGHFQMEVKEVVNWFVEHWNGKVGVKEKVNDVIARMCKVSKEGFVQWIA